jgi:hypothetical protein
MKPDMTYTPFRVEKFPDNILYVKDTDENRRKLTEKLGKTRIADLWDYSYIEINKDTKEWRTCFSFEWLYRNPPPLKTINEVMGEIKKEG